MQNPRSVSTASLVTALLLTSCSSGGGPTPGGTNVPARASEAEWGALAHVRTQPLPEAPRVSVGEFQLVGTPFELGGPVEPGLAISELVGAALLRRADVEWVERRRFAAAVAAERRGDARPAGAPAAGVSPGAEFILSGSWASVGLDSAYLDLRLTQSETGSIVTSWRAATPNDPDPTSLTRTVVGSLLGALGRLDRLPVWSDPSPDAAPVSYRTTGISTDAVEAFLVGLAAEERWDWEAARRGYQTALEEGGARFVEAEAALARAARLRNGGTLGASE